MYEFLEKKDFLKKCKKEFNKYDLKLYKGKYPFSHSDNKGRTNIIITPQQEFICDLLFERGYLFIIEYKIIASCCNHFYCDILVKGKHHLFDLEIDGKQHNFIKSIKVKDYRKDVYLMRHEEIFTIRLKNEVIDNYYTDKKPVLGQLQILNKFFYDKEPKGIFIAGEIGKMEKRIREAKSGKKT